MHTIWEIHTMAKKYMWNQQVKVIRALNESTTMHLKERDTSMETKIERESILNILLHGIIYLPVNRGNGASSRSFDILNRELYARLSFFTAMLLVIGDDFASGTGGGPRGVSASPFR